MNEQMMKRKKERTSDDLYYLQLLLYLIYIWFNCISSVHNYSIQNKFPITDSEVFDVNEPHAVCFNIVRYHKDIKSPEDQLQGTNIVP